MKLCTNFYLHVGIYFLSSFAVIFCNYVAYTKSEATIELKEVMMCPMPSKIDFSPKTPFVKCSPSDYPRYPKCANEVAEIVKEAVKKGVSVKGFGSRNSQTDLICTEGIPVNLLKLQNMKMNRDNTATLGPGVNFHNAAQFLRDHGRAFRTMLANGNTSVGGAIAKGEHGNSLKFDSSLSSQVVKMTIVNYKGEFEVISNSEDLKSFSLSLGVLGFMVDVTFRTVKFYKTLAHNYISCDEVLTNGVAINWAKTTDELTLNWFPRSKEVVVANRTHVDVETCGNAISNHLLLSTYANFARILAKAKKIAFGLTEKTCEAANSLGYHILNVIEYYIQSSLVTHTSEILPIYTEDGSKFKNPAVGFGDLISSSICYDEEMGAKGAACADSHGDDKLISLDSEFSIALCDLPAFVKAVKDITSKTPASFPLQGIRFTFSGKSNIYLSTAYGRDTVNVEFRMLTPTKIFDSPSASIAAYQAMSQMLTQTLKARAHWGKCGLVYHKSDSIKSQLSPTARKKFVAAMNKFDPKGVFLNNMGKRLKGTSTKVDVNPEIGRCAILETCICTKDADCGVSQTCTALPGYCFPVCQTKIETAGCKVTKYKFPKLSEVIKYLEKDVPALADAALRKCK